MKIPKGATHIVLKAEVGYTGISMAESDPIEIADLTMSEDADTIDDALAKEIDQMGLEAAIEEFSLGYWWDFTDADGKVCTEEEAE